jgi:hypothetical protein
MIIIGSMDDKLYHQHTCQSIFLLKSDFQKINQMMTAREKAIRLKVFSESYFFSREQIILISRKAFLQISDTIQPFDILVSSTIPEKLLLSCFTKSFYYFPTQKKL